MDAIRRRAKRPDPLGILLALHEESAGIGKRALQKGTQEKTMHSEIALVPGKRAVRNAPADENDRNLPPPGFAQKIRTDLRFEHQHKPRPHGIECTPNAESPIQREIDAGVGNGHALARQRLPRDSSRRDDQQMIGILFFQSSRESNAGKRFADAYGVNPDHALGMRGQFGEWWKRKPQALHEI